MTGPFLPGFETEPEPPLQRPGKAVESDQRRHRPETPKPAKRTPRPTKTPTEETDKDDSYIRPGLEDWDPWADDPETERARQLMRR